jgi:biopolymer transport protein ExbD
MPAHKPKRPSSRVDMTAMCDVSFLLLTFFILTAKMKPNEPVEVVTPTSISERKRPETDIIQFTIDSKGRVFYDQDNVPARYSLINKLDEKNSLGLSEAEKKQFSLMGAVGIPLRNMKQFLNASTEEQKKMIDKSPGISLDTANGTSELVQWLVYGRVSNPKANVCIKADASVKYPAVNKVITQLKEKDVNKFYLITGLETNPNKVNAVNSKTKQE